MTHDSMNAPQPSPIGSIPVSDCGCPRSDTPWHKDGRCYCPKCNDQETIDAQ